MAALADEFASPKTCCEFLGAINNRDLAVEVC